MAKTNLIQIVSDDLFQTHTISDIDSVQKKLQCEIERKKEELRAMVGEKYRDLIQAVDTIEEMRGTMASTVNHINEMINAYKKLNDVYAVGFKIEPIQPSKEIRVADTKHSIAVEIKLLMEIPEKIWTSIEDEDFIQATQLFIMARHIHTGLQLQIGGKNMKSDFSQFHNLIQQQWNSISNFNEIIINLCKQKLQDIHINIEVACSCLISLYLLDSQTLPELLDTLISLTSKVSLKETLSFDLNKMLDGDIKAHIKEKIVNGVKIVMKTIVLIYSSFVENDGGAVLKKLEDLYRKDNRPLIELVEFSNSSGLKLLPSVIANYRLTSKKELNSLDKDEITSCVKKWSEWVKGFIDINVKTLLQNVTRIKLLHDIREEAFKVETPSNWPVICSSLNIQESHIWCFYFQPLLTNRVIEIIDNRWEKLYDSFKTQMLVGLTKDKENEVEKEADINWFVWKDLIGDTIIESRSDVVKVMNSLMKGMWLQDRGITPTLENLFKSLDAELQKLHEDLKVYLHINKRSTKDKLLYPYEEEDISDQIYSDSNIVQDYLKDVSDRNVNNILQYIKACFEEPTFQSTELQKKTTAIYTARFTQAFFTLMPHLHKCYIEDEYSLSFTVNKDSLNRWKKVCALLKENSIYCWGKWVDIAIENVKELTKCLPQEFTLEANIEYLMMQWDVIKIEEKDDEGNALETLIKVPLGPSLKLQEYLYSTSRILDEIVPHTLPAEIHSSFIEKCAAITLTHYQNVIKENGININQRCALQLLMDVRHVTLLLVPRENKKGMDLSQEVCELLRQKIDPFDYDVFYPHIQANLKKSVQKVQTLFGSLVLNHGQLSGIIGKQAPSAGVLSPTLLATCTNDKHWFSLLPVAAPLSRKNNEQQKKKPQVSASPNKSKSEISDLMSSTLPINFATARSGAASFFNSMTSDWFSGS